MTSVLQILTRAVRLLGAVSQGVALPAGDAEDGRIAFNALIESLNVDSLAIYTKNFDQYDIVANKQVYTIGPSGDIAALPQLRPTTIDRIILNQTTVTPAIDLKLEELTDEQWAGIHVKDLKSTLPTKFYSTGDFPNLRLFLWPIPTIANKLTIWTWNQLSAVTDVNADYNLPQGYERMLTYNLAMELAPEYGVEPTLRVIQIAADSLAAIKRLNTTNPYTHCDAAILGGPSGFNWMTGE